MSRVIKMSTPKGKPANLPKTAALTKAQAEHKAWLKKHGVKVTKLASKGLAATSQSLPQAHCKSEICLV
jgi:hypothetical protein